MQSSLASLILLVADLDIDADKIYCIPAEQLAIDGIAAMTEALSILSDSAVTGKSLEEYNKDGRLDKIFKRINDHEERLILKLRAQGYMQYRSD